MKVVKPMSLGFLSRPFEHQRQHRLTLEALVAFPLRGPMRLVTEQDLWGAVPEALGEQPILSEGMPKSRPEILAAGSAWPRERPASVCPVSIAVGEWKKDLAVVGDREWRAGVPTAPAPFESMPLTWANAYGGEGFAQNPVGKGAKPIEIGGRRVHPLPNVELPGRLIEAPKDAPTPAGFRAIDFTAPSRSRYRGTYDQRYVEQHFPGAPPDQDWRIWNMAPEDQQLDAPIALDARFRVENMHPDHPVLEGALPGLRARCWAIAGEVQPIDNRKRPKGELVEVPMKLTTLWLFPERELGVMIHQGVLDVREDDARDVSLILLAAERVGEPRELSHYEEVVRRRYDPEWGAMYALFEDDLVPGDLAGEIQMEHPELAPTYPMKEHLQRRADRERARAEERAAEHDVSLAEMGIGDGPDLNAPLPTLRELPDRVRSLREELDTRAAEAEQAKADAMEELKQICEEHELDHEEMQRLLGVEHTGPPEFTAVGQRELLREQVREANRREMSLEWLEQQAEDPEAFARWQQTETQLLDAYRKSAHMQSPAPTLDEEASRAERDRLLADLAAGASMDRRDLTGLDLSGADLRGADLSGALMESVRLEGALLDGARLEGTVLAHADLTAASLKGASLRGANLGKARLRRTACDEGTDFSDATMVELRGDEAGLTGATLTGALLLRASLKGADLSGAKLGRATLIEAVMSGCKLTGAHLGGVALIDMDLSGVDFTEAQAAEMNMVGGSVKGATFVRADLTSARFVLRCDARGADFRHAKMLDANLREADLEGADLGGATLHRADLGEANLQGAKLYRIVARRSRWTRADLRGATLMSGDLMEAVFAKADVRGADFRGANLFGADFSRVHGDEATRFDEAIRDRMIVYPMRQP